MAALLVAGLSSAASGYQGREHLTPQEIDLVKDAQVLDKRIDIFIKAADRRMIALNVHT